MKWLLLISLGLGLACFDSRRAAESDCGTFGELCPIPVDSTLVESIASVWLLDLDTLYKESGPMVFGRGGDSAWTVAVYRRLRAYRPEMFARAADSVHAPHLTGVTVEMIGDTARATTSISECLTRQTTYNWREHGLAYRFVAIDGRWELLPEPLAHLAKGKC